MPTAFGSTTDGRSASAPARAAMEGEAAITPWHARMASRRGAAAGSALGAARSKRASLAS